LDPFFLNFVLIFVIFFDTAQWMKSRNCVVSDVLSSSELYMI